VVGVALGGARAAGSNRAYRVLPGVLGRNF
jgi:hypothetical protein